MINKNDLCQKISELYPARGECGIDIDVRHETQNKVWIVDLKKNINGRQF